MVQYRKDELVNGECYHIYNRSIAGFVIFSSSEECQRMIELIDILRFKNFNYQFSHFKKLSDKNQFIELEKLRIENKTLVDIVAYCIMPTHFHLIIRQNKNLGIIKYIAKISNSYSKYFNTKHHRSGPLWSSRFKSVRVQDDEQLLHLTRYIHLNPVSANVVSNPFDWQFSSYKEYLEKTASKICNYKNILEIDPKKYKEFVNNRIDYQRQLSAIKSLIIENYAG